MRILVTGSSGTLGATICSLFEQKGHELMRCTRRGEAGELKLDVTNKAEVFDRIGRSKPDIVIHLAAETDVDKCELQPDHAYKTNTIGTLYVALACQSVDAEMVYTSAACVFDGRTKDVHTEFDDPNPLSICAKSKRQGEHIVASLVRRHFIVRPSWVMGGGSRDKKFVGKMITQIKSNASTLKAVSDKFGTPTYNADFARCLYSLVGSRLYGLYHMGNEGYCSRFEMARKIVEILHREDIQVLPVPSDAFPLPGPRPRSEAIRNYKLDLIGLNTMPKWESALQNYIETEFSEAIKR